MSSGFHLYELTNVFDHYRINLDTDQYTGNLHACRPSNYGTLENEKSINDLPKSEQNHITHQPDYSFISRLNVNEWLNKSLANKNYDYWMNEVKINGYALKYVDKQTEKMCIAAVTQFGNALKYVKNQTAEICIAAVKQYGLALQHVKKTLLTASDLLEICKLAILQNVAALQYVPESFDESYEMCKLAVQQDYSAIIYVKEEFKTEELSILAVRQSPRALLYINEYMKEHYKFARQYVILTKILTDTNFARGFT